MSLPLGLFTQVSGSGPLGPLVLWLRRFFETKSACIVELQRLEHLWNHENMFGARVVRANELIMAAGQDFHFL